MKQASFFKTREQQLKHRIREGLFIVCSALALFLLIAFISYHPSVMPDAKPLDAGGKVGVWLALLFFDSFGYLAYLFPPMLIYWAWLGVRGRFSDAEPDYHFIALRALGFILVLVAGGGLLTLHAAGDSSDLTYGAGGLIGNAAARGLVSWFNLVGTTLLLLAFFLSGITLATGLSWFQVIDKTGAGCLWCYDKLKNMFLLILDAFPRATSPQRQINVPAQLDLKKLGKRTLPRVEPESKPEELIVPPKPVIVKPSRPAAAPPQLPLPLAETMPSLDLLDPPDKPSGKGYSNEELERLSREVELRLLDFGIEVQVVAVHPGPVVTRFEMQLAAGIKVSRITALAKDLARSLSAISVRIVEVIPGKSVVGLELPNRNREIVRLSEVLASSQYEQARSPLSLALGKDIAGHPVVVDLAKMPHLLVAGTTGSGKSVGLNAMILSLLYKANFDQVRLIFIDPKMLELSIYEGIPHLLAPVVTDMKEAANALRWCVAEMDRRYRLMASLGVRNLFGYNQKITDAKQQNKPILDPFWQQSAESSEPPELTTLPYIVVIIDEFADMMMLVGKKVEELIARLAQKARAAGIHLILATQRPSVDVITGLIKANIATRIAFQVSSKIDSRTILDQQGAEQLLGYGDMLYLAPGTGVPVRIHGAYVADHEVHAVVNALRKNGAPNYIEAITEGDTDSASGQDGMPWDLDSESEQDPLYDQAVQIVIETRRASISHIQRRLKIGYNRAARLVEDMERAGLVSPMESNGNREVLVPASPVDN